MTSRDIEIAISNHFGYRQNLIIPNVSRGFNLNYEADILIVSDSGYVTEVEIKTSYSDFNAEKLKNDKAHKNNRIKKFYFAMPEALALKCQPEITDAGLIAIHEHEIYMGVYRQYCKTIKPPKCNHHARKITEKERLKLAELGSMRIWSLKKHINNLEQKIKKLKKEEI